MSHFNNGVWYWFTLYIIICVFSCSKCGMNPCFCMRLFIWKASCISQWQLCKQNLLEIPWARLLFQGRWQIRPGITHFREDLCTHWENLINNVQLRWCDWKITLDLCCLMFYCSVNNYKVYLKKYAFGYLLFATINPKVLYSHWHTLKE